MWRDPWKFSRGMLENIDSEFKEAEDMLNRIFRTVQEKWSHLLWPVFLITTDIR